MHFRKSFSLQKSGILFLFLYLIIPISAIEKDSLRHYNLDTLVVSTFKHENNKLMRPMAASVVTSQLMERQQISEMKGFTGIIPNFMIIDRDTRLTSSVFIRGVGALINTPGVAMYVDGIPHFEKSSFDINSFSFPLSRHPSSTSLRELRRNFRYAFSSRQSERQIRPQHCRKLQLLQRSHHKCSYGEKGQLSRFSFCKYTL